MSERPLWQCPRCGRRYANRNQFHSCVRVPVREHLRGRRPIRSRRFRRVERYGPRSVGHYLSIKRPEELDEELRGWLEEAAAASRQEHLLDASRVSTRGA